MALKRMGTVAFIVLGLASGVAELRPCLAQRGAPPGRGALRIANLQSAGDRDVVPLNSPNLTRMLSNSLKFQVVTDSRQLSLQDPSLVHYPLIYLQGRRPLDFTERDRVALRHHLDPGGGTLFVDAACGNPDFDAFFRQFVAGLLPDHPLVPIPRNDDFFKPRADAVNLNLANAKRTPAAGGKADFPDLEGIKIDDRWAVIYSRIDVGSAIQKRADLDCKGYTHESALKIATNIVLYATLP